jgi:hypothetical protein
MVIEHVAADSEEEYHTRMLCEDLRSSDIVEEVSEFRTNRDHCVVFSMSATRWSCFTTHSLISTHKAIALDFNRAVLPTKMNAFPNFLNCNLQPEYFYDPSEGQMLLIFADCRSFQKLTWRWILPHAVPSSTPPLSIVFSRKVSWFNIAEVRWFCERWAV